MSTSWFDSRDLRDKSPFGAVPCGTRVQFCLRPEAGAAITRCELLAHAEFANHWETVPLEASREDGATVFRGAFIAPRQADLVWYHFRLLWADGGTSCYGKAGLCAWDAVEPWQLTVYDDTHKTPEWFGRGLTYQIFPDRFYRAKKREITGLFGPRTLHEQWDELPEYRPNEQGEITCSDFFGGDLAGITEKLDYLASLGVTTLYLCPIFEASTNHRYDTACYERIDPLLGTEEDFRTLCERARERGIRVLLDGVFNHTGRKSVYFNADGFYPTLGAAQGEQSPYYRWYSFHPFPDDYDAWWGIKNLPAVNETEESYVDYIIEGEHSIIRRWLRAGASGWRLDVADELPDSLICDIRAAMKEEKEDSLLLGEVWEDASNKVSYGALREYFLGSELDATMHYPFRTAVLDFLLGKIRAQAACDAFWTIQEHYPKENLYAALNLIGSHDRARVLTVLGGDVNALKMAMFLQFALPGVPSIYYGDEAGMTGGTDPYNRGSFPWGKGNAPLTDFVRSLTAMYQETPLLRRGKCEMLFFGENVLGCRRFDESGSVLALVNRGEEAVECFGVTVPGRGYILE